MLNPIGKTYEKKDLVSDLVELRSEIYRIATNAMSGHYDNKLYDVPSDMGHLPRIIGDILGEVGDD